MRYWQHSTALPEGVIDMPEWAYFTKDELKCKCGCGICEMDESAVGVFDLLRYQATELWGEDLPFIVTSGYRCPAHDLGVGGVGLHPQGRCMDISVLNSEKRAVILSVVLSHPKIMGIGISSAFLHLDTVPREKRRVWTY